ncbi:MAG: 2-oxoacid:acceptor oxidoreductase family protein, partial [Gammaproteobacteria bacterium]|nr:2-oxoacid:acceptor oxidoreductase family protein [Gammaproteobacteria bacterium]
PLEPDGITKFARGLDLIIVVEEKRSLIETQIREQLYGLKNAPAIVGKKDEAGETLFQAKAALDVNRIAIAIGERLIERTANEALTARVKNLRNVQAQTRNAPSIAKRDAYFCAGCPHNSSTVLPDGARAYAGIGCHWMVQYMGRFTEGYTHMGGEGANWIGEAPFSKRDHMFQNMGDGTYNHSGLMAIRAAVAAGVTMTFKILYNDAVAMTGGQANDGELSGADIANQVAACGVKHVAVVTNERDKYGTGVSLPPGTAIYDRDELARVQREMQGAKGVSVLIFDQTCAAEKRRRRKRGLFPDPAKRVFINELVCEGCGDCGVQSNCVAIVPVETEFGRKRAIDQSSCNKDFSCVDGLCPSFVTVEGGTFLGAAGGNVVRARDRQEADLSNVPEPANRNEDLYSMLVTGIGGTGVVTIGALIGMAAHLDGKACGVLDMTGLAQKGGAVVSHIRIAPHADDIQTIRIAAGGADMVLGSDILVTGSDAVLAAMRKGHTAIVANTHETMPGEFTRNPNYQMPSDMLRVAIESRAAPRATDFLN